MPPTDTLAAQLGRALMARREGLAKSRRRLARDLGVADTTLLALETGQDNPTLDRVENIAAGYGLELRIEAHPIRPVKPPAEEVAADA